MPLDLRVPRDVLEEAGDDLSWKVVAPAWDHVNIYEGARELAETLAPMTAGQRALLALHWCVSEVCNGGFDQFFTNPTGILAPEALEGARLVGAGRTAELIARACAVFPGGHPSRDRAEREDFLETLDEDEREEAFASLDEPFYELMDSELYPRADAYVRAHPGEFFLPG